MPEAYTVRTLIFDDENVIVSLNGLKSEAIAGIMLCLKEFADQELAMILTSARDGSHEDYSPHAAGMAWDISPVDVLDRVPDTVALLQVALGEDYKVVDEGDHIHCEYDPITWETETPLGPPP